MPERLDDFAWENDLVAFRAYGSAIRRTKGPEDSGIDCWLKRVRYGWEKAGAITNAVIWNKYLSDFAHRRSE